MSSSVVWEWQDDDGSWKTYSPAAVLHLENLNSKVQQQSNSNSIVSSGNLQLGHVDPKLSCYFIDIANKVQIRKITGRRRAIRRQVYPPGSAPSKGIIWQWMRDDAQFEDYSLIVSCILEDAFTKNQQTVDLSQHFPSMPYKIDLTNRVQHRKNSGFRRQINRRQLQPAEMFPLIPTKSGVNIQTSQIKNGDGGSSASPLNSTRKKLTSSVAPSTSGLPTTNQRTVLTNGAASNGYFGATSSFMGPSSVTTAIPSNSTSSDNSVLSAITDKPSTSASSSAGAASAAIGGASCSNFTEQAASAADNKSQTPSQGYVKKRASELSSPKEKPKSKRKDPQTKSKSPTKPKTALDVLNKYGNIINPPPPPEECPICRDELSSDSGFGGDDPSCVLKLSKCDHVFHQACLLAMYSSGVKDGSIQCPTCKMIYGEKYGNCPPGRMDYRIIPQPLPSYTCSTIQILYHISPGIQGPEHPNPGQPFSTFGFPRVAYLPNNEAGQKVFKLLCVAWQRRLTFTVGRSSTSGIDGTVTWNEIHHKTEHSTNNGHGYPDESYLDNVTMELAIQGVKEDCLEGETKGPSGKPFNFNF